MMQLLECQTFPNSYIVFDTETSGLEEDSHILQYGLIVVKEGQITDQYELLLAYNASNCQIHPKAAEVHGLTFEKLAGGAEPQAGITVAWDLLTNYVNTTGFPVVGHNVFSFDIPLLERERAQWGKVEKFPGDQVIDTGMIIKASQANIRMTGRPLREWYATVRERRVRVKWNLDFSANLFDLPPEQRGQAHDALGDCVTTHYLYQRIRGLFLEMQEDLRKRAQQRITSKLAGDSFLPKVDSEEIPF